MRCVAQLYPIAPAELFESLGPLRLCRPSHQQAMQRSLATSGQLSPLLAYRDGHRVEVIDGFKRLRGARTLGWSTVDVLVLEVDGVAAKARLVESNAGTGLSELEEAWLIRSLHRDDKLTQPQIAQLLKRHKSWVNRRLLLAESLADAVQADLRLGLLSATNARELCRLPRGNQAQAATVVARRGLTTRQTAALVEQVLAAQDAPGRQAVLERAMAPLPAPGKAGALTPGQRVAADAEQLCRVGMRLMQRLRTHPPASLGGEAKGCMDALRVLPGVLAALGSTLDSLFAKEVINGPAAH